MTKSEHNDSVADAVEEARKAVLGPELYEAVRCVYMICAVVYLRYCELRPFREREEERTGG